MNVCLVLRSSSGSLVKDQAEDSNPASVNQHGSRGTGRASQQNPQTWSVDAMMIERGDERR